MINIYYIMFGIYIIETWYILWINKVIMNIIKEYVLEYVLLSSHQAGIGLFHCESDRDWYFMHMINEYYDLTICARIISE